MNMQEVAELFFDESVRIEKIIWLAAEPEFDALSAQLEEFFEQDSDECGRLFGIDTEQLGNEGAAEWLHRNGKLGFLVQVSTPVPKFYSKDSDTHCCSWGYTQLHWIYTESIDQALVDSIVAWKQGVHAKRKEKQFAEQPL